MKFTTLKFRSWIQFGIVFAAVAIFSVSVTAIANPSHGTMSRPDHLLAQNQIQSPIEIALSGTFAAAEAPTTGSAEIVEAGGQRYLVLDSAFSTTDQAPDLHVILDPSDVPPASYSNFGSFVNLGKLQNITGEQRYPIPDIIDLAQFKSVGIWCRMANATIGYATLQ